MDYMCKPCAIEYPQGNPFFRWSQTASNLQASGRSSQFAFTFFVCRFFLRFRSCLFFIIWPFVVIRLFIIIS